MESNLSLAETELFNKRIQYHCVSLIQDLLKIYLWGKIGFVLGLLARDIANHMLGTHLYPGLKPP